MQEQDLICVLVCAAPEIEVDCKLTDNIYALENQSRLIVDLVANSDMRTSL